MNADLTVTEAIRFSGYSRQQLYNLINAGKVRAKRIARAAPFFLIERVSLEEYMRSKGRMAHGKPA